MFFFLPPSYVAGQGIHHCQLHMTALRDSLVSERTRNITLHPQNNMLTFGWCICCSWIYDSTFFASPFLTLLLLLPTPPAESLKDGCQLFLSFFKTPCGQREDYHWSKALVIMRVNSWGMCLITPSDCSTFERYMSVKFNDILNSLKNSECLIPPLEYYYF